MRFGAYYNNLNMHWNVPFFGFIFWPIIGVLMLAFIVWSLYWKGRALWLSARKGELYWFIALLLINTAGILEILYIYVFSKRSLPKAEPVETREN